MSRIGKQIINIPDNVQVTVAEREMSAKGPKGTLSVSIPEEISFDITENVITFSRSSDQKDIRSLHGLVRALTNNIIEGVTTGFSKTLEINGVGFRAEMKAKRLLLSLGFSHPVLVIPPDGIEFTTPNQTTVVINGIDKQLVGEVASKIRKLRKPEPYKGKGIKYQGEYIRRKAGKTSA